jgi:hypothetical protein
MTTVELKGLIGKRLVWVRVYPKTFSHQKHIYGTEEIDVVLLAVAKSTWAMVRRPGYMPFVINVKYLENAK